MAAASAPSYAELVDTSAFARYDQLSARLAELRECPRQLEHAEAQQKTCRQDAEAASTAAAAASKRLGAHRDKLKSTKSGPRRLMVIGQKKRRRKLCSKVEADEQALAAARARETDTRELERAMSREVARLRPLVAEARQLDGERKRVVDTVVARSSEQAGVAAISREIASTCAEIEVERGLAEALEAIATAQQAAHAQFTMAMKLEQRSQQQNRSDMMWGGNEFVEYGRDRNMQRAGGFARAAHAHLLNVANAASRTPRLREANPALAHELSQVVTAQLAANNFFVDAMIGDGYGGYQRSMINDIMTEQRIVNNMQQIATCMNHAERQLQSVARFRSQVDARVTALRVHASDTLPRALDQEKRRIFAAERRLAGC